MTSRIFDPPSSPSSGQDGLEGYLEQDAMVGDVPPEVSDGVAAVSPAHLDLQRAADAVQVRAILTCEVNCKYILFEDFSTSSAILYRNWLKCAKI